MVRISLSTNSSGQRGTLQHAASLDAALAVCAVLVTSRLPSRWTGLFDAR